MFFNLLNIDMIVGGPANWKSMSLSRMRQLDVLLVFSLITNSIRCVKDQINTLNHKNNETKTFVSLACLLGCFTSDYIMCAKKPVLMN